MHEFIKVRLHEYKWKGGVSEFLTEDAFIVLALASSNHPRRAVRILAEGLKVVAGNKSDAQKQITKESMVTAALNASNPLDEKDWIVLNYLHEHGQSSASDDGLRAALGFVKSKRVDGYHTSVDRRLRAVAIRLRLYFVEIPTGNTKKKVLYSPDIPKD